MAALPSHHDFTELAAGWTSRKKAVFLDHLSPKCNVGNRLRSGTVRTLGPFARPTAEFTRDIA